mmetsp:Transcript_59508/g.168679  ORF Transcript_59508/g.168679 Transcript_59508/m.168679 type:complete len:98 (-) Transcript_59508:650-943(-)
MRPIVIADLAPAHVFANRQCGAGLYLGFFAREQAVRHRPLPRLLRRGQEPGRLSQVPVRRVGVTFLRASVLCMWSSRLGPVERDCLNVLSVLMYSSC